VNILGGCPRAFNTGPDDHHGYWHRVMGVVQSS
jgi:hypothetical protein